MLWWSINGYEKFCRPAFGGFLPVAFLDAEHNFQFPTLTLTQFLHLHLIQHLQWPGHRGHGKPAQARASSSPGLAAMRRFVGPNAPDPTAWLALQINPSVLDGLSRRSSLVFLWVLLQSHGQAYEMAVLRESQLQQHFHESLSQQQQQLHKALKYNWKAASWPLPCGFQQKLPFSPPSPQENLTFHLLK